MPRLRKSGAETVRTTLDMPVALWKRAKVRAMDERRDLRDVLLAALRAYLASPHTKDEGGES
jgi:hypothetical protein